MPWGVGPVLRIQRQCVCGVFTRNDFSARGLALLPGDDFVHREPVSNFFALMQSARRAGGNHVACGKQRHAGGRRVGGDAAAAAHFRRADFVRADLVVMHGDAAIGDTAQGSTCQLFKSREIFSQRIKPGNVSSMKIAAA